MPVKDVYTGTVVNKPCSKCLITKSVDCFGIQRRNHDGLRKVCRTCMGMSETRIANQHAIDRLADGFKTCSRCFIEKRLSEFTKNGPDVKAMCKVCKYESSKIWAANNPDKIKLYQKTSKSKVDKKKRTAKNAVLRRKKLYGLTTDDYNAMLEIQAGVCACCKLPESIISYPGGPIRSLHVDHCHSSGKVRGLLCGRCNTAIAHFRDNPDTCRAAADYLEKSK